MNDYCEVPVGKNYVALVDKSDFRLVRGKTWHARIDGTRVSAGHSYRDPATKKTVNVHMHRLIMGAVAGQIVDHANGNALDNRRLNLRFATPAQNAANRRSVGASRYLGVTRERGLWTASIYPDGKSIHLGTWPTEQLAAAAYNRAATLIHREFARFNAVPRLPDDAWDSVLQSKKDAIEKLTSALAYLESK